MTESEWLMCDDPVVMLEFIGGKVSERKLRLFACASCRRIWHLLTDSRSRDAVATAERYADKQAEDMELVVAAMTAYSAVLDEARGAPMIDISGVWELTGEELPVSPASAAFLAVADDHLPFVSGFSYGASAAALTARYVAEAGCAQVERNVQSFLLRDLMGNPFRPVAVDPSWLCWENGALAKMAQSIYEERHFQDLPILADALENAGCDNADILAHCRQPGEHARGCWVVDLLLGKSW